MIDHIPPRRRYLMRKDSLWRERQPFVSTWKDIADHIAPLRPRFFAKAASEGGRANETIINPHPTIASRTLRAGLMQGMTPRSQPWLELGAPDPEMNKYGPVRDWIYQAQQILLRTYDQSNFYTSMSALYGDLGDFGTHAMLIEEHDRDVIRCFNFPIGQYALASAADGRVNTLYREFQMTIAQVVEQFGLDACSIETRRAYEQGNLDERISILHVIEPNDSPIHGRLDSSGMPWRSVWMEVDSGEDTGFLRKSGYWDFPVIAPRWQAVGSDDYGTLCPGMVALPSCRALQYFELKKAQITDSTLEPPTAGPPALGGRRVSLLPRTHTEISKSEAGQGIEPIVKMDPKASEQVRLNIAEEKLNIDEAYYKSLFLSLMYLEDRDRTAREIAERKEEALSQLGPVFDSMHGEVLDPAVANTLGILFRAGKLPEPPPELQGQVLQVKYVSTLAQAQKLVGMKSIDRFTATVFAAADAQPEVLDKVSPDDLVDAIADSLGLPPKIVVSNEVAQAKRQQRAEQQQAMAQGEAMLAAAQGAKDLAGADMGGDNLLAHLMGGGGGP